MSSFYAGVMNALQAHANCKANGNHAMADEWDGYIAWIMKNHAPSGSGFDNGTTLDFGASRTKTPERLVFNTSFHHMNDAGMYDGWTEHQVTVRPCFSGLDIRVTGRNRNEIKEFIGDVFHHLDTGEIPTLRDWRAAQKGA